MNANIDLPMDRIEAFCRKWQVVELSLFGSVLTPEFRPDSDVDVLVRFGAEAHPTLFDLAAMREELELLTGRPVDLVSRRAVESSPNPIRREAILGSAEVVYAA